MLFPENFIHLLVSKLKSTIWILCLEKKKKTKEHKKLRNSIENESGHSKKKMVLSLKEWSVGSGHLFNPTQRGAHSSTRKIPIKTRLQPFFTRLPMPITLPGQHITRRKGLMVTAYVVALLQHIFFIHRLLNLNPQRATIFFRYSRIGYYGIYGKVAWSVAVANIQCVWV